MTQQAGMLLLWNAVGSRLVRQVLVLLLATTLAVQLMGQVLQHNLLLAALILQVWQQQCGWVAWLCCCTVLCISFSCCVFAGVFALAGNILETGSAAVLHQASVIGTLLERV
jgi:hypothetical protein